MRLKSWFVVCLLSIYVPQTGHTFEGPYSSAMPVRSEFSEGFASIDEGSSEAILAHLVEGDMQGRGTGQEGFLKAARWFASELESCGFQPAGDDGTWFQNVPFLKHVTVPERCQFQVGEDRVVTGGDLGISDFAGSWDGTLPVVFIRLLKDRPQFTDGQFMGKLVVIQSPGRMGADDAFFARTRPACVLLVSDAGRVRNEAVSRSEQTPATFPVLTVTQSGANRLSSRCGVHPEFFTEKEPAENRVVTSDVPVQCQVQVEREAIDVPNVVGWYPGRDPAVQHEHICIGAHLDHLGVQRGELYPGADDNGSGSTAILQVARAIHANPVKPERSVLLIAFCAEERGLLGSKYYIQNPRKPLKDMICMLNIDMIGRNEESGSEPASENETTIHLVGSQDHSSEFHQLVLAANQGVGFEFEYDEENVVDGRSDHASFSEKGIPVAFLFGGFNPHYHKPTDNLDGINFSKIANAARLNYLVLMTAAEHGAFKLDAK